MSQTDVIGKLIVLFPEAILVQIEAYSVIQPLLFVLHGPLNSKVFQYIIKNA